MRKVLTLIVVPHDNSGTRNYRVSYRLLYTFVALVGLFLLVVAFFVASYGRILVRATAADRLERENRELLVEMSRIDSLEAELVELQALGIQVKRMLGVELSRSDSALVARLSASARSPAIAGDFTMAQEDGKVQRKMLESVPSIWPVKGYVTREFNTTGGEKSDSYHPGIDIAARRNSPIVASSEGIVVTSGWDDTYGNMVVIDHGFGIYTIYGHNSRNLVKAGDRVARGQVIAFIGSTGKSTASHLHFEVRKNGLPVDPREYLLQ